MVTFAWCNRSMATPQPRRPPPQKRKSNLPAGDAVASRAVVPKKLIFERPLPAFIRPQLAKLVTEAPEGERWAHELKFDGYRVIEFIGIARAIARDPVRLLKQYIGQEPFSKQRSALTR
jgi:ATP-dependent DNA ligase